jgi:ATP synthase I chain
VKITDDNLPTFLAVCSVCLVAVFSITGWILVSGRFAGSVAVGGCLALLNFIWLRSALTNILQMPAEKAFQAANIRYILRLSALAFMLWLLIVKAGLNIFGLLIGLSVLVISIVLMSFYKLLHSGG